MRRFAQQCLALGRRDLALQRTYGTSALLGMFAAVIGLLAYHYIGRLVDADHGSRFAGGSYFAFVWSGIMVQLVVASSLGALSGALAREAAEGTLEPGLAAGAMPMALVVGGAGAPLLLALLQVAIHAGVGIPLFGLELGGARPLAAGVALVATLVACSPIGLVGAASWLLLRRPGFVTTVALFSFSVLGGIYFPVDLLPQPVAALAAWIPLTVGLDAVRGALLEGAGLDGIAGELSRLALLAGLGLPPAIWILRWSVARALRRGTFAFV